MNINKVELGNGIEQILLEFLDDEEHGTDVHVNNMLMLFGKWIDSLYITTPEHLGDCINGYDYRVIKKKLEKEYFRNIKE